ncbi:MAG: hypothetical protein JWO44_241 [Bacteroidetes bacterium]|jgi:hypothetical protein|nr:hypothetical protein [Bacteroidota bacterium]
MAKKVNRNLAKIYGEGGSGRAPAAVTDVPATGLQISLVMQVAGEELILTGNSFKEGIKVEYTRHWDEAAELGTFNDGLAYLGKALGNETLAADVAGFIQGLPPFLKPVFEALTTAQLILTDLMINSKGEFEDETGKQDVYTLGIGLKFTTDITVGNIKMQAFLVKYTYKKPHKIAV